MKNTIEGFNQPILLQLGLTGDMAIFLRWLLSFMSGGKTRHIIVDGNVFHWIKYTKVIEDLPVIFKNIHALRRMLPKISSSKENEKPLIFKAVHIPGHGTETYFRFDPTILERLEGTKMSDPFLTAEDLPKQPKEKNKQPRAYNKNAYSLLEQIKKIKIDGKEIFPHELPEDATYYTNTYATFESYVMGLYTGTFIQEHPIDSIADWFKIKYKYYYQQKKIKALLQSCKGDWLQTEKVLLNAVKNYSLWFSDGSEMQSKKKLPRNINTWIYFRNENISMFYVCLLEEPTSLREANADKAYNSLSPKAQNIMLKLYNDNWDGFTYWNNVKDIVKWYRQYADKLCEKDSNCIWWIGNGLYSFLENYKEWLLSFTNNPNPGNIGIGNKTWSCYISSKKKEHDISINIPSSL